MSTAAKIMEKKKASDELSKQIRSIPKRLAAKFPAMAELMDLKFGDQRDVKLLMGQVPSEVYDGGAQVAAEIFEEVGWEKASFGDP